MRDIKELVKEKWYIQGLIGCPLFLITSARSGFSMKEYFGFSYDHFMYSFNEDYAEGFYLAKDFKILWFKLEEKLSEDPDYFNKLRDDYNKAFRKCLEKVKSIDFSRLLDTDEDAFIGYANDILELAESSLGIAHIIEAFSVVNEGVLRHKIKEKVSDKKEVNKFLDILLHPVNESWTNKQEKSLYDISLTEDETDRENKLKKHADKYFWIRNNYLKAEALTKEDFLNDIKNIKHFGDIDYTRIRIKKQEAILKLDLDEKTRHLIELIDFFTDFQDERKRNILLSLHYLELLSIATSEIYNIDSRLVRYLGPGEFNSGILNNPELPEILKSRKEGCYVVQSSDGEMFYTGFKFNEIKKQLEISKITENDVSGMTAYGGNVIGIARVCRTMESINEVNEGDILVASMTRPEYLPAMKKAAAIVTDEGGVTCHAAIVSRELNKPCVIGTKIATKVIKSGDLIEVKANHGVVRILNNEV